MTTKKEREDIKQSFERTMNNCIFYETEGKTIALVNEIGVLRGLCYAMQILGIGSFNSEEFLHFIDVQQKLKRGE